MSRQNALALQASGTSPLTMRCARPSTSLSCDARSPISTDVLCAAAAPDSAAISCRGDHGSSLPEAARGEIDGVLLGAGGFLGVGSDTFSPRALPRCFSTATRTTPALEQARERPILERPHQQLARYELSRAAAPAVGNVSSGSVVGDVMWRCLERRGGASAAAASRPTQSQLARDLRAGAAPDEARTRTYTSQRLNRVLNVSDKLARSAVTVHIERVLVLRVRGSGARALFRSGWCGPSRSHREVRVRESIRCQRTRKAAGSRSTPSIHRARFRQARP